jgi:ribosomal protein L14
VNLIVKTKLKVVDNSGILYAELIKVLGNGKKYGRIGDKVVLVIKSYSNK